MIETFTHETFAHSEGESFPVRLEDGATVELRLVSARVWGEAAGNQRAPFTLTFAGPLSRVLPQRIYSIANERIGEFELFLVPIGPVGGEMRYEAIFT